MAEKRNRFLFLFKDGSFPFCSFCVFPPLSSPGSGDAESRAFPLWEYRIHLPQTPAAQKSVCASVCARAARLWCEREHAYNEGMTGREGEEEERKGERKGGVVFNRG